MTINNKALVRILQEKPLFNKSIRVLSLCTKTLKILNPARKETDAQKRTIEQKKRLGYSYMLLVETTLNNREFESFDKEETGSITFSSRILVAKYQNCFGNCSIRKTFFPRLAEDSADFSKRLISSSPAALFLFTLVR